MRVAGRVRNPVIWRAVILLVWPALLMADWATTMMLLTAGGIELNPIIRFVLQFGALPFLALKIFQLILMVTLGLSLKYILREITFILGWAPRTDIILWMWTLLLLMPVAWNAYNLWL